MCARALRSCLSGLLMILSAAAISHAAIFSANFENGTVGSNVPTSSPANEPTVNINPNNSTPWNGSNLGNRIQQGFVDGSFTFGDGKVAVVTDGNTSSGATLDFVATGNPTISGTMVVQWDTCFQTAGQSNNTWITFVNSSNQTIFQMMSNVSGTTVALSLFEFATPGGSSTQYPVGSHALGAKITFRVEIDLTGNKAVAKMNGSTLLSGSKSEFNIDANTNFAGTKMFTSGSGTRTFAVDNFTSQVPLTIVSGGTSAYKIYRPDTSPQSVLDAAVDLQTVIAAATNVTLQITGTASSPMIALGDNPTAGGLQYSTTAMAPESYRIVTNGSNLFILGPDTATGQLTPEGGFSRGTRNGVSGFCETVLNARWLLPGTNGLDVPLTSTVVVPPQDATKTPSFPGRELAYVGTNNNQYGSSTQQYKDITAWMQRNRLGRSVYYEHAHGWSDYPATAALQPAWMAMTAPGGVRQNIATTAAKDRKFCTTNTGLQDAYAAALNTKFINEPARLSISLSPTDGIGGCYCTNPNCIQYVTTGAAGSYGGFGHTRTRHMLVWYRDEATRLAQLYPAQATKKLGAYIYNEYNLPDTVLPKINLPSTVQLYYAPRHYYGMTLFRTTPTNALNQYQADLAAWHAAYPGQINYSDYPMWAHNDIGAPLPCGASVLNTTINAHKLGNTKHMLYNSNSAWGWAGIKHYILARKLWDSTLDASALRTEFLQRAYGTAAAVHMGQLYDLLDSTWTTFVNDTSSPIWMTEMTNPMITWVVLPAFAQMESLYVAADGTSMTVAQQARLDQFGLNMKVLCWRLRHMGADMSGSIFNMDDGTFDSTMKTTHAANIALAFNWVNIVNGMNDHLRYNVTHDDVPVVAGSPQAIPKLAVTPLINTRFQDASNWNGTTGGQIHYDYRDSALNTAFPNLKQVVLKDAATGSSSATAWFEMVGKEADAMSMGVYQTTFRMMVDSNSTADRFFVQFNNSSNKQVATMRINVGATPSIEAIAYSAPNVISGGYVLVQNISKATVYDIKIEMDFTAAVPIAKYYVNGALKLTRNMPKWCDMMKIKVFSSEPTLGTLVTDDWYVGR